MSCIFCDIVSGEKPSRKIYEDDHVLAFLNINPITPGHTLIIPKEHFENLNDISELAMGKVATISKELADKYTQKLQCDGFNLRLNSGKVAHQDVFHLHLHLIPRYDDDGLDLMAKRNDTQIDLDQVHSRIVS